MKLNLENTFKKDYDGALSILCRTKEISGQGTTMLLPNLSSPKIIEVRKEVYYSWPQAIKAEEIETESVEIDSVKHCKVEKKRSHWTITPSLNFNFFTLKISDKNLPPVNSDEKPKEEEEGPTVTVTIGEP